MTLQEAITQVRALLAEVTEGFFKDSEITTWLNKGNNLFHSHKGIKDIWQTDVLSGDLTVGIDSTMLHLKMLYFTKDGETTPVYVPSSEYIVYRDKIIFKNPLLKGTLTWYGDRLPVEPVTTSDSLEIDKRFGEALIDYAVYRALQKDEDPKEAAFFLGRFEQQKASWQREAIDINAGARVRIKKRW